MDRPGVSIVLVNYKTPALLLKCIEAIIAYTKGCTYEIIVVDNHSCDDSETQVLAAFPNVRWFNMGYNSGFARGNNKGIAMANGDFVLMLNSDTWLTEDAITKSLEKYIALENEINIGLLGCKICSDNGNALGSVHNGFLGLAKPFTQNPFVIFFSRHKTQNSGYPQQWYNTSHTCDHLSGAFVFFRKSKLSSPDLLLDEDFFLYSEDVEWCYRLKQKGFQHYFFAGTQVFHHDGGSSVDTGWKLGQIFLSQLLFVYKTRGVIYFWLYVTLLKFNSWLDNLLHQRNASSPPAVETSRLLEQRAEESFILKKYFRVILNTYKLQPSASNKFLVYEKPAH